MNRNGKRDVILLEIPGNIYIYIVYISKAQLNFDKNRENYDIVKSHLLSFSLSDVPNLISFVMMILFPAFPIFPRLPLARLWANTLQLHAP